MSSETDARDLSIAVRLTMCSVTLDISCWVFSSFFLYCDGMYTEKILLKNWLSDDYILSGKQKAFVLNCIFVQSCTFTVVSRLLHHFYLQCTHSELKACFSLIHGVLQLSCHVYDISYIFFSVTGNTNQMLQKTANWRRYF